MTQKLINLNPRWFGSGGEGVTDRNGDPVPERTGIGITFDCPCATCVAEAANSDYRRRQAVAFSNPLDGGPAVGHEMHLWHRFGETFETLSLSPSILSSKDKGGCGWHGFVGTNGAVPGEVITV